MYKLEQVECPGRIAAWHCIAWIKYFDDHGYQVIANSAFIQYSKGMLSDTREMYDAICDLDLETLCPAGTDLFPTYGTRWNNRKENTPGTLHIKFHSDDYEKIRASTRENGMSIQFYCRNMILKGRVVNLDLSLLVDYGNQLTEYKTLLFRGRLCYTGIRKVVFSWHL